MEKLRAEDNEKVKVEQTKWKLSSRAKLRAEDNEAAKRQHKNHQASSMAKLRAEDNDKVKQDKVAIEKHGKTERRGQLKG